MLEKMSERGLIILVVLAMLSWAGAWPSGKLVAGLASPQLIIFWRFLVTSILLVPLLRLSGTDLRLTGADFWVLIGGAVLMTAYNQFFFAGLKLGLHIGKTMFG